VTSLASLKGRLTLALAKARPVTAWDDTFLKDMRALEAQGGYPSLRQLGALERMADPGKRRRENFAAARARKRAAEAFAEDDGNDYMESLYGDTTIFI
jgi:hypothetical protein